MNACAQCGRPARRRFCRKACNSKWVRDHETRPCATDGCEGKVRARGLCSTHYNQITNHLTTSNEVRRGDPELRKQRDLEHHKRRRAILRGAHAEKIDRLAIFERDHWVCWLCSQAVSKTAKWPDVMCPSIDHVAPLADGGDHTAANIRLAHFLCNVRRGRKTVSTQLALTG